MSGGYGLWLALYDYRALDNSQLSFKAGDHVNVLEMDEATGWWRGERGGR